MSYNPFQPYEQDFLNGFQSMSNRNPMQAAQAVAPPAVPKAKGRIGSLPTPKKKPVQMPAPLQVPRGLPRIAALPAPSPVPQGVPGQPTLPEPSPEPQGKPTDIIDMRNFMRISDPNSPTYQDDQYQEWQHIAGPKGSFEDHLAKTKDWVNWYEHGDGTVTPIQRGQVVGQRQTHAQAGLPNPPGQQQPPARGQAVYDGLPSFTNPGQLTRFRDPRQGPDGLIHQNGYAFEPGSKIDLQMNGPQGMLPGRPQIQQSYGMPTQRPGFLPSGMGVAPMPTYQPGAVTGSGSATQALMNQVLQKQLMDQLNYKAPSTGPGVLDSLMQIGSGIMPGASKYLDSAVSGIQGNRQRAAQQAQQDDVSRRAWTTQMLSGINSNDPLALASQDQLFARQSDWQKNQIAGVQAGTQAYTAEDNAQRWRAQEPSQQWVAQQGAANAFLGQQNTAEQNRYNFLNLEAQRQASEAQRRQAQLEAEAQRANAWRIAQFNAAQNDKERDWKRENSRLQYGGVGGKGKGQGPLDAAKVIQGFFDKDGKVKIQDPELFKMTAVPVLTAAGVPPEQIQAYINKLSAPAEVQKDTNPLSQFLNLAGTGWNVAQNVMNHAGGQQQQAPQATPQQGKPLTPEVVAQLKKQFKGDKKAAMEAARKAGYAVQ